MNSIHKLNRLMNNECGNMDELSYDTVKLQKISLNCAQQAPRGNHKNDDTQPLRIGKTKVICMIRNSSGAECNKRSK